MPKNYPPKLNPPGGHAVCLDFWPVGSKMLSAAQAGTQWSASESQTLAGEAMYDVREHLDDSGVSGSGGERR